ALGEVGGTVFQSGGLLVERDASLRVTDGRDTPAFPVVQGRYLVSRGAVRFVLANGENFTPIHLDIALPADASRRDLLIAGLSAEGIVRSTVTLPAPRSPAGPAVFHRVFLPPELHQATHFTISADHFAFDNLAVRQWGDDAPLIVFVASDPSAWRPSPRAIALGDESHLAVLEVLRYGPSDNELTIEAAHTGSATAGVDFEPMGWDLMSRTLSFTPTQRRASIALASRVASPSPLTREVTISPAASPGYESGTLPGATFLFGSSRFAVWQAERGNTFPEVSGISPEARFLLDLDENAGPSLRWREVAGFPRGFVLSYFLNHEDRALALQLSQSSDFQQWTPASGPTQVNSDGLVDEVLIYAGDGRTPLFFKFEASSSSSLE
ncbi:MAG: hypothetical protein ACLFU2_07320, partial [Opitutales bacterium]